MYNAIEKKLKRTHIFGGVVRFKNNHPVRAIYFYVFFFFSGFLKSMKC